MDAPEIDALAAAREASEHARALEAASDQRSYTERLVPALLFCVAFFLVSIFARTVVIESLAGFGLALLVGITLGAEVYYLRRRVKALTYLVLERERQSHEP